MMIIVKAQYQIIIIIIIIIIIVIIIIIITIIIIVIIIIIIIKGKGIQFIVLYPPKHSHNLLPLAGLYTRTPFQSPGGYSRAVSSKL